MIFGLSFFELWVCIVIGILTFSSLQLRRKAAHKEEDLPPERIFVPRSFTEEELSKYRGLGPKGTPEELIFVSVKGIVYNVAREWYGPEAAYHAFSGADASRQLGKVKVSREEINTDWTCMSDEHIQTLNEWEERFRMKYTPVGWFVPSPSYFSKSLMFER